MTGRCSLTHLPLPEGSRKSRLFVSDRARVLNGYLTALENTMDELNRLIPDGPEGDAARSALRGRLWRLANSVPANRKAYRKTVTSDTLDRL